VLTIRDISELDKVAKLEADNKMVTLYTSSITHELLAPLKCIIELGNVILRKVKDPKTIEHINLVISTAQLLLSEVKLLLDKNLLEN
jgi:hypothetical protein